MSREALVEAVKAAAADGRPRRRRPWIGGALRARASPAACRRAAWRPWPVRGQWGGRGGSFRTPRPVGRRTVGTAGRALHRTWMWWNRSPFRTLPGRVGATLRGASAAAVCCRLRRPALLPLLPGVATPGCARM
jgi:hypothetical protein